MVEHSKGHTFPYFDKEMRDCWYYSDHIEKENYKVFINLNSRTTKRKKDCFIHYICLLFNGKKDSNSDYDNYPWHIFSANERIFPYQPFPAIRKKLLFRYDATVPKRLLQKP